MTMAQPTTRNLFEEGPIDAPSDQHAPLANRMRPRSLSEFVGQDHLVGHVALVVERANRVEAALGLCG